MIGHYNEQISFGQYEGLSIREIYQGTFHMDPVFFAAYLDRILNVETNYKEIYQEFQFIDRFEVSPGLIKVLGDIFDPEKPLSPSNRINLGNVQASIEGYINMHFRENMFGTLLNLKNYNKEQPKPLPIGGDPEYLWWCERQIDHFQLSEDCKRALNALPVIRLNGVKLAYIGEETYEYMPDYEVVMLKFK